MAAEPAFYRDLAYVFGAAVLGGLIARRLRQPLIIGYVLGGIVVGPFTPGPTVSEFHTLELLAEVGVILLMYAIGIEFSVRELMRVKWVAVLGGPLGIVVSIALSLGVGRLLGWSLQQSAVIGAVVSVASTMVLSRLLMDGGQLNTAHGRIMIGITLMEDLTVVILTVLLPEMGSMSLGHVANVGLAIGKSLLILVPILLLAAKLAPPLMARVARMENDELYILVTLAVGFATAAATQAAGLSLALGAFLAGLVVSGSQHAHEILARVTPLRDTFGALFFVTVGALINPSSLVSNLPLMGAIIGLIVFGKLAVWTGVVWIFRYPIRTALLVAVGLTQIGEFSYVLVRVARDAGLVGADVYNATLAASLLTILLNAALMRMGFAMAGSPRREG